MKKDDVADAETKEKARSLIQKLAWAANEIRFDKLGETSLLSQKFPDITYGDVKAINATRQKMIDTSDVGIWVRAIPQEDWLPFVISDASKDNAEGGTSQLCHAIGIAVLGVIGPGALIAGVSNAVSVSVVLVGVGVIDAVVTGVGYAIAVRVCRGPKAGVAGVTRTVTVRIILTWVAVRRAVVAPLPRA